MYHGGKGPLWLAVLIAAEDWGCPPWEIAEDEDKLTWFYRWMEYKSQRNQRDKVKSGRKS